MKKSKNGLDEMQKEKRNAIGNQTLMLMVYALLLDIILNGLGIHWLQYPANTMLIIVVCMAVYVIRTVAANACQPPKASGKKTVISLILLVALSIAIAVAAFFLFGDLSSESALETVNDNSALILLIVSAGGLLISLIVAIIKKARDGNDSED